MQNLPCQIMKINSNLKMKWIINKKSLPKLHLKIDCYLLPLKRIKGKIQNMPIPKQPKANKKKFHFIKTKIKHKNCYLNSIFNIVMQVANIKADKGYIRLNLAIIICYLIALPKNVHFAKLEVILILVSHRAMLSIANRIN